MRYVRFTIFVLFIIVVLVPATLYGVAYFLVNSPIGSAQARARVTALFPNAGLGFEDVEVGAVPLDLHVHGLRLGPDSAQPVATIEHLAIGVDPRSFLGGPTRVDLVHVDGFDVRLELDENGRLKAGDLLKGPLTPKEGEPPRAAKPMELRDLMLSNGTLRLAAPGWDLRLNGTSCAGRIASGAMAELNLSCSIAGGEAHLTPAHDSPLTLNIGPSKVETLVLQREGERVRRLVVDGLHVELDGVALQGSLTAAPAAEGGVPVFTLALNGGLPESVARLLSQRRVEGSVAIQVMAQGDAQRLDVTLDRLAVDGRVRLPDRSLTGVAFSEVRLEAKDRDVSLMGKLAVAGVSGGDLRATDVSLEAAVLARLPEGGVAQLLARPALGGSAAGSPAAPPVAPQSLRVHIDRLAAATVEAGAVRVNGLSIADVDGEWGGLNASLRVGRATAATVAAGAQQLADLSLRGEAALDGTSATAKARLDLGPAGRGALDAVATVAMERDGFTLRLPLTVDLRVLDVPGALLAALLPADLAQRAEVAALLPGPVNGTLRVEGDARQMGALKLAAAELRVPREKDVVVFGPAAEPLGAEGGAIAVDPASRRLRLGPATFAWQTEKVTRPR